MDHRLGNPRGRELQAELGARLETAIATLNRARDALDELGRILPSIVADAQRAGAETAVERILRAAMSPSDQPDSLPVASPGKPTARRPGRRAGGGAVQQQMLAVADAAGAAGLPRGELPSALAVKAGKEVPRSSYVGALSKLLELGELVERDARIFSAAHASVAVNVEEVPPEPMQAASGGVVQGEDQEEGGDEHAAAIEHDDDVVPATGTHGRFV